MRVIVVIGALALAGCETGKINPTGIAPPASYLMVEPRRIKGLREGGDLKKYALILAARNGDLVDHVKALQAYAAEVSGVKVVRAAD